MKISEEKREQLLENARAHYWRNKTKMRANGAAHYWKNRDRIFVRKAEQKVKVLSHYGPDQELKCSWPGCIVTDVDMLTLDHIIEVGRARVFQGCAFYSYLSKRNFPDGYQTLCANHQMKKEFERRRRERKNVPSAK
jgi:hypothetical protein